METIQAQQAEKRKYIQFIMDVNMDEKVLCVVVGEYCKMQGLERIISNL